VAGPTRKAHSSTRQGVNPPYPRYSSPTTGTSRWSATSRCRLRRASLRRLHGSAHALVCRERQRACRAPSSR
jgi:hypothetical protein